MQHSAHNASGRREDRVPLAAVVSVRDSVRGSDTEQQLEADGLNVSVGGIAMRARFVPEPGTLLECTFSCPPTGELVSAQGEVVWSEPHGLGHGQFGLRFVELDTKSATALRRLVRKDQGEAPKASRSRTARMRIDGLEAGVDAELKLVDETRVVLEQPIAFLQLGRGVNVTVPGRGDERGRIASIELRHGPLDTPRLVLGILLDEASTQPSSVPAPVENAAWFTGELEDPFPSVPTRATKTAWGKQRPTDRESESPREPGERISELALDRTSELALDQASARSLDRASARFRDPLAARMAAARDALAGQSPTTTLQGLGGRLSEREDEVRQRELALESVPADGSQEKVHLLETPRRRESAPEWTRDSSTDLARDSSVAYERASLSELDAPTEYGSAEPRAYERDSVVEGRDSVIEGVVVDERVWADGDENRPEHPPALTLRNLPAHVRTLFGTSAHHLSELRQRIEPALREQAESLDLPEAKGRLLLRLARLRAALGAFFARFKRGSTSSVDPAKKKRPVRLRMQRSTLPGIGGGPGEEEPVESSRGPRMLAIALAVIGVGLGAYALAPRSPAEEIALPARIASAELTASANAEAPVEDALALDIEPAPAKPEGKKKKKDAAKAAAPALEAAAEATSPAVPPFGEPEVPNGRVFTLRMNGPVTALEGEAFENGFTVKVPGRTPIDPARPIASAHRAVQRALFMNHGKYAELTIEFLPGLAPRYQVRAKGDTLEITLERL